MKKVIFSAALLMGACTLSFAGTPKGETKDAKSETPSESTVKAKQMHTYWVLNRDGNDYVLTTTEPSGGCPGGSDPCQITTEEDFSSNLRVDQEKVDTQDGVSIIERKNL